MNSNPMSMSDPAGDYAIFAYIGPTVSISSDGLSIGFGASVGVGFANVVDLSVYGGYSYNVGTGEGSWDAGVGLRVGGESIGVSASYSFVRGTWNASAGYGAASRGGISLNAGVSYGSGGFGYGVSLGYSKGKRWELGGNTGVVPDHGAGQGEERPGGESKVQNDDPLWDLNGDGSLSLHEANEWFRNGGGQSIFVDAQTVDLNFINPDDWFPGEYRRVQTLTKSKSGRVFGNIDLIYKGNNQFFIGPDDYHFPHAPGSGVFRNFANKIGKIYAGKGTEFRIYFLGRNTVNYNPPPIPRGIMPFN